MEETQSSIPEYRNGKVFCDGIEYVMQVNSAERRFYEKEGLDPLVNPKPGEVPERVRGCVIYGGRLFVPKAQSSTHEAWTVGEDVLKHYRERGRANLGRQTSSIPEEFWPEVLRRTHAGETVREITRWLNEEKRLDTTHGSVGRLCRRLLTAEAAKDEADQRHRDLDGYKHQYRESLNVIEELRIEAFRRAVAGDQEDDRALERAFRFAKSEAQLLDRQIRLGTSRLASIPKPPPPPTPKREEQWEKLERELQAKDAQAAREKQAAAEAARPQAALPAPEAKREEPAKAEPRADALSDAEWEKKLEKMRKEKEKVFREADKALARAGKFLGVFLLVTFGGLLSARAATVDSPFERGCTPSGVPFMQSSRQATELGLMQARWTWPRAGGAKLELHAPSALPGRPAERIASLERARGAATFDDRSGR